MRKSLLPLAFAISIAILVLGYILYIKQTAFRKGMLVPDSLGHDHIIDLSKSRLKPIGRSIKIGKHGEVNSQGAGKQARIGVGLKDQVYLKPESDQVVMLNGQMIHEKNPLDDGSKIDINGYTFTFYDKVS